MEETRLIVGLITPAGFPGKMVKKADSSSVPPDGTGNDHATEGSSGRLIVIGDVHGCSHALDAVLDAIQPSAQDTIVILGDFIDQGRDTRHVIERLIALDRQCRLVCILGNHEEMMLAAVSGEGNARTYWENAGGVATMFSYRFGGSIDDIPAQHLEFVRGCINYYETDRFIFVHANCDPELPLADQPVHMLRWAMLDPSGQLCHSSGKTMICGHTEQLHGEVLDLDCVKCIDTACWRYGWLTALDVKSGQLWQASRFGVLRERDESPVGPIVDRPVSGGLTR